MKKDSNDGIQSEWSEYELREGLKSRLLEEEALKRGFEVERLTFDKMIVSINGKHLLFKDMNGPMSSTAINEIVDNKYLARTLIKKTGISTPSSTYLLIHQKEEILDFVLPVVFCRFRRIMIL